MEIKNVIGRVAQIENYYLFLYMKHRDSEIQAI